MYPVKRGEKGEAVFTVSSLRNKGAVLPFRHSRVPHYQAGGVMVFPGFRNRYVIGCILQSVRFEGRMGA